MVKYFMHKATGLKLINVIQSQNIHFINSGEEWLFHFEFETTRIALFCILNRLSSDTILLTAQITLQYSK